MEDKKYVILEMDISQTGENGEEKVSFLTPEKSIESAISEAKKEEAELDQIISSVDKLKPDCDKVDYALAASSGILCGVIDIFLVAKPGESKIGDITDQQFAKLTKLFAKSCGWTPKEGYSDNAQLKSAIRFLEDHFKVPYDQTSLLDMGGLSPINHHFKSLGHNPTLLGLFFSILDQFKNQSHVVIDGRLVLCPTSDGSFELRGSNIPAKILAGFVNWIGHLVSDMMGSSGSGGRGMGIPSPLWAMTNDIIMIKNKLPMRFGDDLVKNLNELAVQIYNQGYDLRHQVAQAVPVVINEMLARLVYSIRRMVNYFKSNPKDTWSVKAMWESCKPVSNPSVSRMLLVAHGVFCMINTGNAALRAGVTGGFNVVEFALRFNIVGAGRFTVSLYGEAKQQISIHRAEVDAEFARKMKIINTDYLEQLKLLAEERKDEACLNFVRDYQSGDIYKINDGFVRSVEIAKSRGVPEKKIIDSKAQGAHIFSRRYAK